MPELPEVETVRRGLLPAMAGRRIARADIRREGLRWPFPQGLAQRLTGTRVEGIGRRSKYLLVHLEGGDTLLVHLGMSGRMVVGGRVLGEYAQDVGTTGAPSPHDHVVLDMEGDEDDGARVTFNDARRFGAMDLWRTDDLQSHPLLRHLGPEPLDDAWGPEALAVAFRGRRAPVKAALLDQRLVAGIGNIYASEALSRARIHPARAAGRIGAARVAALAGAVKDVLAEAIAAGGSTLRDHRQADGSAGGFQRAFRVYDREGAPCPTEGCGGTVRRLVQGARSSYFCPRCQR